MTTRRVVVLVLMLLLAASGSTAAQQTAATVKLSDITVATQPDAVTVFIKTSAPVKYQAELIDTPTRLVIDFEGTDYVWRKTPLDVAASPLFQIRGSQYKKGVARIVMQLDRKVGYAIREDDAGLAIVIPTASQAKAPANTATSTALAGTPDKPADAESTTPARLPIVKPLPQVRVAQAPVRTAAATTMATANLGGAVAQAAPNTPPAPVTPAPAEGHRLTS